MEAFCNALDKSDRKRSLMVKCLTFLGFTSLSFLSLICCPACQAASNTYVDCVLLLRATERVYFASRAANGQSISIGRVRSKIRKKNGSAASGSGDNRSVLARWIPHFYFSLVTFYGVEITGVSVVIFVVVVSFPPLIVVTLPLPIGAPPLFHSKNLTMLSSFGCISSRKTAIMLLRGVSIPPVELVLKYATPMPVDSSLFMYSVKSPVAFSLPSSVVM